MKYTVETDMGREMEVEASYIAILTSGALVFYREQEDGDPFKAKIFYACAPGTWRSVEEATE